MNSDLIYKTQQRYMKLVAMSNKKYGRVSPIGIQKESQLLTRWKREMSKVLGDVRTVH